MTRISSCTCKNEFQDKRYGKNNRVFNETAKENLYRCTVCGKDKMITK